MTISHCFWRKRAGISIDPVKLERRRTYHRKEHQKSWGFMSRIIHLMNLSHGCRGSTGVQDYRQEEPPLGQFGGHWSPGGECFAPCFDHMNITRHCAPAQRNRILSGHLPYGDAISRPKIMISENDNILIHEHPGSFQRASKSWGLM